MRLLIIILIYAYNSADDNGGNYQKVNTSANAICKYVTGFSFIADIARDAQDLRGLPTKNIIVNHSDMIFLIALRIEYRLKDAFFVQKFNNRLLFSTFIYCLVKITNIISMIRQQVPENDVKKITSQAGRA
ncbi:hypothetical protein LNO10_14885 [Klebsiella variicola subsp. variicola]|nr:hypothetical protein [Klebsiella variicola subsp. variicola]